MKVKDIAKSYGVSADRLNKWLPTSGFAYKESMLGGYDVDDAQDIDEIVAAFRKHGEAERLLLEQKRKAQQEREADERQADLERQKAAALAAKEKQQALSSMLITSGFSFDGFTITKYSGYISGDDALQVPRGKQGWFGGGVTDVGEKLMDALVKIRRTALNELKEAAYDLGCNAVIGVDFDYITLEPETVNSQGGTLYLPYVFGVTANGNAVVIEKTLHH